MTAPRERQRVKVVIPEALVMERNEGHVQIRYDDATGDSEFASYIPVGWCEVLADPLKVGDMLGTTSSEPPAGTIVSTEAREGRRVTWTRIDGTDDPWVPSHYYSPDTWFSYVSRQNPRVEYLPEVAK